MLIYRARFHLLLHSAHLIEAQLEARLEVLGIRPRQARVIDALGRMGEASQIDLARQFGVTPASMSTMTARLISAGLVSKEPSPLEARSNVLRLTWKGQDLLAEIYRAWRDIDDLLVEKLGFEKSKALADLTHELRDALGGRTPGTHAPQRASHTFQDKT